MPIMRHCKVQVQWPFVMSAIHATHIVRWPKALPGENRIACGGWGRADKMSAG
jgi:hypothetical protein